MIDIRPATETDAAILSDLNREVQALHYEALPWRFKAPSPEQFSLGEVKRLLSNGNNVILIAKVDGAPVGYILYEIVREGETAFKHAYDVVYVHQIAVRVGARRRGVGRALIDAARQAGLALGIARVALDFLSFNDEARAFYKRLGFAPDKERWWTS
jgi:ribosomal protein S18 acetylase RimI-like enzyme